MIMKDLPTREVLLLQRRTMPYENFDLSDHPGIGSAQADVYAAFLFSKSRISITARENL